MMVGLPREDEYFFTRLLMTLYALDTKNDFPGVENIFSSRSKNMVGKVEEYGGANNS
jgi:hypothetical protein